MAAILLQITYPGYNLAWSDEFTGAALNQTYWNYETGDGCPKLRMGK